MRDRRMNIEKKKTYGRRRKEGKLYRGCIDDYDVPGWIQNANQRIRGGSLICLLPRGMSMQSPTSGGGERKM